VIEFRDRYQQQAGTSFDLKHFNDEALDEEPLRAAAHSGSRALDDGSSTPAKVSQNRRNQAPNHVQ